MEIATLTTLLEKKKSPSNLAQIRDGGEKSRALRKIPAASSRRGRGWGGKDLREETNVTEKLNSIKRRDCFLKLR